MYLLHAQGPCMQTYLDGQSGMKRKRQTENQTDRQAGRQKNRQVGRQRNRQVGRKRNRTTHGWVVPFFLFRCFLPSFPFSVLPSFLPPTHFIEVEEGKRGFLYSVVQDDFVNSVSFHLICSSFPTSATMRECGNGSFVFVPFLSCSKVFLCVRAVVVFLKHELMRD